MKKTDRSHSPAVAAYTPADEKHVMDYVRVLYKRRWIAIPAFLIVFTIGAVNALRQTPVYQSRAQLQIEKDTPSVTTLDQMFQSNDGWYNDDFYQTQYRILQSRSLTARAIDSMQLWNAPRLGNGPEPKASISVTALFWTALYKGIDLAKKPFAADAAEPAPIKKEPKDARESAAQSVRIDEFLSGVSIVPVRNSHIVEVRYSSTDPIFAAAAANALANAYIDQNVEGKSSTSQEAAGWLKEQLDEQKSAVDASERRLQDYREKYGAVSVSDSASNIVVAQLTDLNTALTKAKTDRIAKEAAFNQLKALENTPAVDTLPAVLSNGYIQKLKSSLADLQRQEATLAERLGPRHEQMIKVRSEIQSTEAKLQTEVQKVVDSMRNEYETALSEERTLQGALNQQKGQALTLGRTGIEYSVLQREAESNRQIYESLLQRTKEIDISSGRKTTNVRIVDKAEVPRAPISPNVQRDLMFAFGGSLLLACGLGFLFERLDNRIKTPNELKATLSVPFLGMVPVTPVDKKSPDPLVSNDVSANFSEAFKTIRMNVLFSSAEGGMRSLVVTSAGPGEGKSIVSSNIAIALSQAAQRVLLIDADMRRPRVHDIFKFDQEPGLSNVLTGNAKTSEAIRRSSLPNLWLLSSGHIPPNPAELLGSHRFADFMGSLEPHFDWVVVDTPPVLVVADGSIVANKVSSVVFVTAADHTSRQAAHAAMEQLDAASAHVIGAVLNRADIVRNPYYYAAYYRKEYSKYYISAATRS
jgi:capsular exopolysaccharide synthesis family protein